MVTFHDERHPAQSLQTSSTAKVAASANPSKNQRTAVMLFGLVAGMLALSFAAVPLYDLFCRVTGYGGTTQVAEQVPVEVSDRRVTVRFTSNIGRNLPWSFRPKIRAVDIQVGESMLVAYQASNLASRPVTGTATFNVTPLKAGQYFNKVQCFCFNEQTLEPGRRMDMPVYFFVDPRFADDPEMADVSTITLSYTFFPVKNPQTTQLSLPRVPG
jgi:cytochrome c oxidase assembly protein subunit 11